MELPSLAGISEGEGYVVDAFLLFATQMSVSFVICLLSMHGIVCHERVLALEREHKRFRETCAEYSLAVLATDPLHLGL